MSMLLQSLSGREDCKVISPHEAASLWSLVDRIAAYFRNSDSFSDSSWISFLDGFYFSYVIRHIGKEFDLLKVSSDGEYVLNIELKSEQVDEDRIKKQLEQNRYYLSHIARSIYSFTYVMETDDLYTMNEKGYLRKCEIPELAAALTKEAFRDYMPDGLDPCFRASEYLISPIASPEKYLQGKYFLTNQQFDFRRRILELLQVQKADPQQDPVISISGIAGTGKTLLLLDLAMELSRRHRVLFIHSGPLRQGHLIIDERLKNVDLCSISLYPEGQIPDGYDYVMIDEADHLNVALLKALLNQTCKRCIPLLLTYDPHQLLSEITDSGSSSPSEEASSRSIAFIRQNSTLQLSFSGNIRINRPVYSFLRTLLYLKDNPGNQDFSCIDVLYANDEEEKRQLRSYFAELGYELLSCEDGEESADTIIAREYDTVLMILDNTYYYDETLHLCVKEDEEKALRLLYEGLSRTRNKLCLLIVGNTELFLHILGIRLGLRSVKNDLPEAAEANDFQKGEFR